MEVRPTTRRVRKFGAPPRRIVIADDSASLRTTIRLLLSTTDGPEIVEAANGFEALRILDDGGADLLICDLAMPGLDGRKLNQILATRIDRPDVVVMSGSRPTHEEAWAHDSIIGWLEKPFEADDLLALVFPTRARQTAS
ncbi:MAG: response regulator [Myxococcales bacterium]|nr:response regulator [Myxococcales bacterium]